MRAIEPSNAFKRDYKREVKGKYRKTLSDDLGNVLILLADDKPLDIRY